MPVEKIAVDPVTTQRDASLQEIAGTMREENLGDVIVVEDGKPVGIVTDRDIALQVADSGDVSDVTAEDVMTEDPVTIEGSAEDIELPRRMAEEGVRRVPVVDGDGNLTGIATLDDVVATIGEEMEDVATVIESQSPEYSPD